ncbi:hypothetical protein [Methylobacterium tardum]|uniref:hypothetical protein n=1 Tax=Methylobacterium tardum TaxID=374432 RepID=UPI0036102426
MAGAADRAVAAALVIPAVPGALDGTAAPAGTFGAAALARRAMASLAEGGSAAGAALASRAGAGAAVGRSAACTGAAWPAAIFRTAPRPGAGGAP